MRKSILIFLLLLSALWPSVSQAQTGEAATWLRIPTDARSAALAGSTCSIVNSTGALNINPAGLELINGSVITFSHDSWVEELILEHGAFGTQIGPIGFAASADYLNFGSISAFTVNNGQAVANGTITPQALALTAGGAMKISKDFMAGVSGKFFGQSLGTPFVSSVEANFGVMYKNVNGLSAGLALLNAGPQLSGFSLPLQFSLGLGYSLTLTDEPSMGPKPHQFTVAGECDYLPNTLVANYSLGAEYTYRRIFSVRVGYKIAPYGDASGADGLAAGLGLFLDQFDISYALTVVGSLGTSNQVALSLRL